MAESLQPKWGDDSDDLPPWRILQGAAEIVGCACGSDHEVMPADGGDLVCRVHKRHIPCRPCMNRKVLMLFTGFSETVIAELGGMPNDAHPPT